MFVDNNLTTFYTKRAENYHTQCKYNFVWNVLRIFQIIVCVCYTRALIIVYLCVFLLHLFAFLYCITILSTFIVYFVFPHHNSYFYIPTPRNVGVLKQELVSTLLVHLFWKGCPQVVMDESITALVLMTECKRVSCVWRMSNFLVFTKKPTKNLQQVVMSNSLQGQGVIIDEQFPGNYSDQILFFSHVTI